MCRFQATESVLSDVRDFGAIGDGKPLYTSAIQAAIDACHSNAGETVWGSAGSFLSGTIYMNAHQLRSRSGDAYCAISAIVLLGHRASTGGRVGLCGQKCSRSCFEHRAGA